MKILMTHASEPDQRLPSWHGSILQPAPNDTALWQRHTWENALLNSAVGENWTCYLKTANITATSPLGPWTPRKL